MSLKAHLPLNYTCCIMISHSMVDPRRNTAKDHNNLLYILTFKIQLAFRRFSFFLHFHSVRVGGGALADFTSETTCFPVVGASHFSTPLCSEWDCQRIHSPKDFKHLLGYKREALMISKFKSFSEYMGARLNPQTNMIF